MGEHLRMLRHYARLRPVLDGLGGTPLPVTVRARFANVRELLAPSAEPEPEVAALMPGIRRPGATPSRPIARLIESLASVEEGLGAAHYHAQRVEELERRIAEVCKTSMAGDGPDQGTVAFRAPVLGFEYHAFLFALRRSLDYLAGGVAACFGHQSQSIRRLPRTLTPTEPASRVRDIQRLLAAASPYLSSILTDGNDRSVRDQVAHWEVVDAGYFNVRWDEQGEVIIELVGGGENLPPFRDLDAGIAPLGELLRGQIAIAEDLVFDLVESASAAQRERSERR